LEVKSEIFIQTLDVDLYSSHRMCSPKNFTWLTFNT